MSLKQTKGDGFVKFNGKIASLVVALSLMMSSVVFAEVGYPNPQQNQEMTKSQITLFKEAMAKVGAATPEKAATLWADGVKNRNGVFQYAAASNALKKSIEKDLGKVEDHLWVTGGSSPWVEYYQMGKLTKVSATKYTVKVTYHWKTSAGPEKPTTQSLTIVKENDSWYVGSYQ